ncbi:MAG: hypothetical protein ACI9EP_000175 [Oceanospirillaceae bacterium]
MNDVKAQGYKFGGHIILQLKVGYNCEITKFAS